MHAGKLYDYIRLITKNQTMADDKNFDPWSNPQPPKKKPKTGGNIPPGGSGGGQKPDPELDEVLKKFHQNTKNLFNSGDGNKRLILIIAAALAFLWLAVGSVFFVASGEKAVVLRFGKYERTVENGLNFKFPPPFEKKYVQNVENTARVGVGEGSEENLMVTGDENIVDVEFVVRWNIKNLEDFLFNVASPDVTAKKAAESAMREVIGSQSMSFALGEGEGRAKISILVQDRLQEMLDAYASGIRVVAVDLKKIDVPMQVIDAQIDVQNAKTEQERVKNQAEAYRNDILPRANGEAAKRIEDAQAYKQSVVARAKGDASRFMAVYRQYAGAKEVTRSRIYLETMQEVLGNMDKTIIDGDSRTIPYLPLNSLRLGTEAKDGK